MRRRAAPIAPALLAAAALLPAPARADEASPPSSEFALTGCHVVTAAGPDVPDGVVIVRGGRIVKVGPRGDVAVPRGVPVVDVAGRWVTPAFVHPATRIGLAGSGGGSENGVSPAKTVADELDPWRPENRWAAANGFATLGLLPGRGAVGGRGVAVRAAAEDLASFVRRDDVLLRSDVSQGSRFVSTLGGQLSIARKDLDTHAKWEREHAAWEKAKTEAEAAKKKPPDEPKEPKQSEDRAPYRAVLRGESALLCLADSSADVLSLTEALADERVRGEDMRVVVTLTGDAYRAAPQLLDLGAVCVVRAVYESWPNTDQTVCPAAYLHRAGLPIVLAPRADSRAGLRSYALDIARVVAAGVPREVAWRAATSGAAALLGVEETTGSVQEGRAADLVLWSGDPLLATSRLERVWIEGEPVEDTP